MSIKVCCNCNQSKFWYEANLFYECHVWWSYWYDQFTHITVEYKGKQVKDCVICHLTFKGNGPLLLIWSYRYDIITSMWPFNSYHMLTLWIVIHDWSQYKRFAQFIPIDMIISIWCDHIDMIRQSSCWLSN